MISKLTNVSIKKLDESGKIADTGVEIYGVVLSAAGADATVVIHNSEDDSGDEVLKLSAVQNTSESISFPHPVSLSAGAYADLSGSNAEVSIAYKG